MISSISSYFSWKRRSRSTSKTLQLDQRPPSLGWTPNPGKSPSPRLSGGRGFSLNDPLLELRVHAHAEVARRLEVTQHAILKDPELAKQTVA